MPLYTGNLTPLEFNPFKPNQDNIRYIIALNFALKANDQTTIVKNAFLLSLY